MINLDKIDLGMNATNSLNSIELPSYLGHVDPKRCKMFRLETITVVGLFGRIIYVSNAAYGARGTELPFKLKTSEAA